jgi:hypothetical protein
VCVCVCVCVCVEYGSRQKQYINGGFFFSPDIEESAEPDSKRKGGPKCQTQNSMPL